MTEAPEPRLSPGYQLFMLVLCLYALAALAMQTAVHLQPQARTVIDYADYAVCALFFLDFAVSLIRAPNRWRYLATWGWLDLLSSIPSVDFARLGRAARILRVFRVLRGLRAARIITTLLVHRRAENTALAASLITLLLVIFCSVAVLHFETNAEAFANANIKTAEDAIWWSVATITTVGYGDRFPTTSEGRLVAAILMCAGVGLFGTFSGLLAAWFLGPQKAAEESDVNAQLQALRDQIAALRQDLAKTNLTGDRP